MGQVARRDRGSPVVLRRLEVPRVELRASLGWGCSPGCWLQASVHNGPPWRVWEWVLRGCGEVPVAQPHIVKFGSDGPVGTWGSQMSLRFLSGT